MLNKVIHNTLNGHKMSHRYLMIISFGFRMKYCVVDVFLQFKDKYALQEGHHC